MSQLFALAVQYGGLLLDVVVTLARAHAEQLTEAECLAEVERIKRKEAEQCEADWDVVQS